MSQKIVRFLLASYIFFTLYNTLIPFNFDFAFSELGERIGKISLTPYFVDGKRVSMTDIVGNIILFMPFGFLFYLLRPRQQKVVGILLAAIAGAGLSLSIEFFQLFLKSRDSAIHDLINNALGALAGAVAASIYTSKFSEMIRRQFYVVLEKKPYALIVIFFALGQFISSVMPFTVSVSISSLWANVKESNIAPFTYHPLGAMMGYADPKARYKIDQESLQTLALLGTPVDVLSPLQTVSEQPGMSQRRFRKAIRSAIGKNNYDSHIDLIMQSARVENPDYFSFGKFLENLIFWAAVGYVIMLCYLLYWQNKTFGMLFLWIIPMAYFLFVETFQLIISSRITDMNDVMSGYCGVLIGYVIYNIIPPSPKAFLDMDIQMLKVPVMIYLVFIMFSGLYPFDWSTDPSVIARDMKIGNLVPFYAYFRNTNLWNIYDLASTLALFVPVSLYLSYTLKQNDKLYPTIYLITTLSGLLFGLVIEASQLFSYQRVAEITDIIAFAAGGAIGTFLLYYYENQIAPIVNEIRFGKNLTIGQQEFF